MLAVSLSQSISEYLGSPRPDGLTVTYTKVLTWNISISEGVFFHFPLFTSFIIKQLLSDCTVPGTMLGSKYTVVSKIDIALL